MGNKTFGFAIIGTGSIAHIHAQAIAAIDSAVLVGVFSKTMQKAEEFALKYNCSVYDSLDVLLKVEGLDIVCICTPSGAHIEPAIQSMAAGKHCFIEKPLEVSLEKCDLIIQKAKENNVKVAVVFPSRFYPSSNKIKQALDAERFGDLVLGSAYVKWSRDEKYYASAPWRGTWELDGGGALMNQAIHSVDLLQWYMGPVVSVQALIANRRHTSIEVEDTVVATLKFASGALGTIECTTAAFPGSFKRLEIVGTEGTAIMEESNLLTWQFRKEEKEDDAIRQEHSGVVSKGGVADPMDIGYFGHQEQIVDFIEAIQQDIAPLVDGEEGRKSVQIVCAIYESARIGKEVTLSR